MSAAEPTLFDTDPRVIARGTDPDTSHAAARAIAPRTGTQKALILHAHARNRGGLTDEETGPLAGLTYHAAERRCCDLRNEGMLMILTESDGSPVLRRGSSGMWMRVSVLTDLGMTTVWRMGNP